MKEMVGGCCVCSDEHGWTENPLVYCDGQNCTVAVHQACYGIVTVPTGPWYCRKCESQERSARVRCELCPSRDGALKKTDNQGWAHVVCALYIPEVRFGNVTTMEPIILQLIPQERFAKTCYICTDNSKPSRATAGACMQCNKSGCKQQFHVTCAQALGLLCEEAGNYLDNVKYCGYCQHHYSKLKKGGNVKTIPPYKPITHETGSSDSPSSPEKETTNTNQNISTIPSGSSSSSTTIKITQSSTSSSSVSIMPVLPPATTSTSSSSSSKQRKSSSASKNSSNSSSSIINNMSSGSSASIGGGGGGSSINQISGGGSGGGSSKSNSSSTKDKEKHSKSVSGSKSSSKNDKNDLSSTSTANLSNSSSSSARDKRDSKSSKSSSSNSSNSNNKDDSLNINATSSSSNKISSNTQQGNILSSSSSSSSSSHKDSISSKTTALSTTTAISTQQSENVLNISQLQDPVQIFANTNSNTGSSSNVTNDLNTSSNSNKGNSSTNSITSSVGGNTSGSGNTSIAKKRKAESSSSKSTTIDDLNKDLIKDVSVTIVPITNIDKLDSMDFEKNSKKSKTSDSSSTSSLSSASLQIINEPNLQNVSPNQNINVPQPVPQLPPPQSQQPNLKPSSLNITSSQSSTQSQSIIKPLKDVNDSRLHSTTGQQNSISPFSGAGSQLPQAPILPIIQQQQQPQQLQLSSQSQQQQQSLVVSVPLSNAGVNIPSNNTIQTNNNQAIHQGSGLYQHMAQTREQLSASGSRASPIVNYQQNHQTSSIPSNLGRKSPLIQGAALSPSPHLNELNMHNQHLQQQPQQQQQQPNISVLQNVSPSLVNNSSAISGNSSNPNNSSSSGTSSSIITGSSSAIATTSDTGMLKITYEKQPNSRIAQLQDDIPARRSSRSQSNESTKSRTSKKRALIPPSSSPSTATTSSSLSSSVFPENNSASTSNSCHLSNNNNNSNSNNSVNNNSNNNSKNSILSPSQFPPTIIGHQSNVHLTSVSAPPAANNNNNANTNNNNNNNSNTANNHNNNNNKKQTAVSSRIQTNETPPPSTSRTPDTNYTTISYGGGLKFTYEAQPNTGTPSTQQPSSLSTANPTTVVPPVSITPQPIKDSPPSSPGSEAGSRKRSRKSTESKNDVKIFQNGVVATHMLGNQINPASSVAQKMTDQLNMEIEAHSIYTSTSLDSGPQLVGPPYPGKSQSNSRSSSTQPGGLGSILSGSSSSSQSGNSHQSLEQLLERQWEQGSQFLMEQAQHFDIASLLSCLHQLRTENIRLEDHVNNLVARRDHLLAVNARLAIPLNPPVASQAQGPYNNMHINGPTDIPPNLSNSRSNRTSSSSQQSSQQQSHFNAQQPQSQSQIIENGVDFRGHGAIPASGHQIPTNPSSRHSSMSYTSTHNSSSSRQQQQQQQSAISINIDQQQTSRNRTFQQTNYSTAHQPQLRPDDSQVKPS